MSFPIVPKNTGFETNFRRYVEPREDDRIFKPVTINPIDRECDKKKLKDLEEENFRAKNDFREDVRYTNRLLSKAKSYNIRGLPEIPNIRTVDEYIKNRKELEGFHTYLENLIKFFENAKKIKKVNKTKAVDPNLEKATTLLGKAKFYNIKGIPNEVPKDVNLKNFIESLQIIIHEHNQRKADETLRLMLEMRDEKSLSERRYSNSRKSNCSKIALPLISFIGILLLSLVK